MSVQHSILWVQGAGSVLVSLGTLSDKADKVNEWRKRTTAGGSWQADSVPYRQNVRPGSTEASCDMPFFLPET